LQQAILNAEAYAQSKNIRIETNKKLVDRNGIEREFDVYWEYELGGHIYKSVIECKDYTSPVSLEKIDALLGKVHDLPEINKLIFATKTGYQSGAQVKAEQNNIDLLIVRPMNDSDWEDENGNPLLRYINITGQLYFLPRLKKFEPIADKEWLIQNGYADRLETLTFCGKPDEIIIEDRSNNSKVSLMNILESLSDSKMHGDFEKRIELKDAYFSCNGKTYKVKGYNIAYTLLEPIESKIALDFANEFMGVIEYLQRHKKVEVLKNGNIRQRNIRGGNDDPLPRQ